jgi:acetyl esterase/lipase
MDREPSVYEKRVVYQVPGMEGVQAHRDLVYKSVEGTDLKLDVYVPPGLPAGTQLPGVLFIHGGPLPVDARPRPKDWGVFVSYGELMAASGLVGVTFNHRYHALTDLERCNQDVLAAIQYVRERSASFHLDPDRLCLWVFSGGGSFLHLALRHKPDFVRCAVAYYAALDLSDKDKKALGDEVFNKFALASCLAPEDYAQVPLFIARAALDRPALNERIERFVRRAIAANATLDFVNHPQGQHGFDLLDDDARSRHVIASTIAFIQANV